MYDAYTRIFTRLGLEFRAVAADNGEIGGTGSHEFQVLASSGEDAIAVCRASDYAANVEMAEAIAPDAPRGAATQPMAKVSTPGMHTCEAVAEFLKIPIEKTVKSIVVMNNNGVYKGTDVNPTGGPDVAPTVFVKGARYDKLAEAFGGVGVHATTPAELRKAMEEAVRSRKPTLINAVIDETAGTESGRITSLNPSAAKKK